MKRIVLFLLLSVFVFTAPVFAQTASRGNNVVLSRGSSVNENYFASGNSVTLSGTVNGDAYLAGGNILVDGTVNGNLLVAGGQVNVTGTVNGNVRAIGGQVNISGQVQGNASAAGGNVNVDKSAVIKGSVVAAAGQLSVMAPVPGSVTAAADTVTLGNSIGGNVLAATGRLTLTSTASIAGNLNYTSQEKAQMQPGSRVAGRTTYSLMRRGPVNPAQARRAAGGALLAYRFVQALVGFFLGWIMIRLFPVLVRRPVQAIEGRPGAVVLAGLLVLIVTPFIIFIFLMTVALIPVALILLALWLIEIYLSKIFFALWLGKKIGDWLSFGPSYLAYLAAGLLAWIILVSLPFIGWLFSLASLVIGIGAMWTVKQYYFRLMRERNLA